MSEVSGGVSSGRTPPRILSSNSISSSGLKSSYYVFNSGVSSGGVISEGVRGSGISLLPISLFINIHLIFRLDPDSASAATRASVADSAAASNDGVSRPITTPNPGGGSRSSGTGRGDSGRGTVADAQISPFSKVSSEKNFT